MLLGSSNSPHGFMVNCLFGTSQHMIIDFALRCEVEFGAYYVQTKNLTENNIRVCKTQAIAMGCTSLNY